MSKPLLKQQAIKLRKRKYSYSRISRELGISKSTVSLWLRGLEWSSKMTDELLAKAKKKSKENLEKAVNKRREDYQRAYQKAVADARSQFKKFSKDPVFLFGVVGYWGEGDKLLTNSFIRLSNIDPQFIRLFVIFLEKYCDVRKEKIRAWLLLYPDLNEDQCKKFWFKHAGLDGTKFVKNQYILGRHQNRRISNGVCNIYVCGKALKYKILTWIELLGKM